MVRPAALAVAEAMRELEEKRHPRHQQLLHGEFRRGMEKTRPLPLARLDELGGKGHEMRLEAGADLERGRVDLDEAAAGEEMPDGGDHPAARLEIGALRREALRPPPWLMRHVLSLARTGRAPSNRRSPGGSRARKDRQRSSRGWAGCRGCAARAASAANCAR